MDLDELQSTVSGMTERELQAERARLLHEIRKLGSVARLSKRNAQVRSEVESLEVQLDVVQAEITARGASR